MNLNALVKFLEKNSYYPKREDLEAILRRCDHNANQLLTFDEFCESVSVNEYNFN